MSGILKLWVIMTVAFNVVVAVPLLLLTGRPEPIVGGNLGLVFICTVFALLERFDTT